MEWSVKLNNVTFPTLLSKFYNTCLGKYKFILYMVFRLGLRVLRILHIVHCDLPSKGSRVHSKIMFFKQCSQSCNMLQKINFLLIWSRVNLETEISSSQVLILSGFQHRSKSLQTWKLKCSSLISFYNTVGTAQQDHGIHGSNKISFRQFPQAGSNPRKREFG